MFLLDRSALVDDPYLSDPWMEGEDDDEEEDDECHCPNCTHIDEA